MNFKILFHNFAKGNQNNQDRGAECYKFIFVCNSTKGIMGGGGGNKLKFEGHL